MPFHDQNMRALGCLGKRVKPKEKNFLTSANASVVSSRGQKLTKIGDHTMTMEYIVCRNG